MADVTITIPDEHVTRVLDAFAGLGGWVDVPTSGTKAAFAKAEIIRHIRATVKVWEDQEAARVAVAAVTAPPALT